MADGSSANQAFGASLGFATNPIDRLEARRNDAAFVEGLRRDATSRTLLFVGDDLVLNGDNSPWFGFGEAAAPAPAALEVLLGIRDGRARFATALDADYAESLKTRGGLAVADLRSVAIAGELPAADVGALAQAKAVLSWHRSHRFCAACGTESVLAGAGWRRECPNCGTHHFPRTDPVVIMLATDGERCLLGRQPRFPPGMYSCLAGFLEPGETIEDGVRRELFEEAGIVTGPVTYLGTQPWPFPTSLMIGCLARATTTDITIDRTELEDARWFPRDEARAIMEGRHPEELRCPPQMAIANHIMRRWIEGA
jgi:NAD+ diphosphatase